MNGLVFRRGSFVIRDDRPEAPFVALKLTGTGRAPKHPIGGAATLREAVLLINTAQRHA